MRLVLLAIVFAALLFGCLGSDGNYAPAPQQEQPPFTEPSPAIIPEPKPQAVNSTANAEPEGKLELVRSFHYVSDNGFYHISGIVKNTGAVPLKHVRAKVVYYLANGTPAGGEGYVVSPAYLAPGESGAFIVTVGISKGYDVGRYEASAGSFVATKPSADTFSISNQKFSTSGSYVTASADITNTGTAPATADWASAIFYDANGNVLETGSDVLGLGLKPGSTKRVSYTVGNPGGTLPIVRADILVDYGS